MYSSNNSISEQIITKSVPKMNIKDKTLDINNIITTSKVSKIYAYQSQMCFKINLKIRKININNELTSSDPGLANRSISLSLYNSSM